MNDLRQSLRSLARQWGMSLALVLTIALGIGSNAAVYGFVDGFVTPTLPITSLERVVSLFSIEAQRSLARLSYEAYLSIASTVDMFEQLGAARESRIRMTVGARRLTVAAAAITADFAVVLGLPPGDGIVISDRLRRGEFRTTPDLSAERVRIEDLELPIAGVAPAGIEGIYAGRSVDVWVPLREGMVSGPDRASPTFTVLGRLRPGITTESRRVRRVERTDAQLFGCRDFRLRPLQGYWTPE